jgi:uncharacterized repeat protein (TIGR03987 family)
MMRSLEWFFFAAFILYSLAIWADRLRGTLRPWMVGVFAAGLAADTAGTLIICSSAFDAFRINLHTLTGAASLVIMAVHFLWALLALRLGPIHAVRFRRWSPFAWSLWLLSFFSGAFFH